MLKVFHECMVSILALPGIFFCGIDSAASLVALELSYPGFQSKPTGHVQILLNEGGSTNGQAKDWMKLPLEETTTVEKVRIKLELSLYEKSSI